ncbi:leucine-rich repeat receptor-like protein kinase PXC1 [Typha latifolia]|uniref:leucine-rich repeat receptor-like protein kinase PXC1 n=1 Tax=Typha latifolia TaxID=4733 RepID=UPI003C2BA6FF
MHSTFYHRLLLLTFFCNAIAGRITTQNDSNSIGEIPNATVLQSLDDSEDNHPKEKSDWLSKTIPLPIFIFLVVSLVLALLLTIFALYKKSKKIKLAKEENQNAKSDRDDDHDVASSTEEKRPEVGAQQGKLTFVKGGDLGYDLDDLLKSSAEGLGKGNFGSCYKAILDHGRILVVKRLRDVRPLTREEFAKHVTLLASMQHPNILPLVAFYYSPEEKLLIHTYAVNGNLFDRIHGGRGTNRIPFKWNTRLFVALGVGRAMEFLHHNMVGPTTLIPHGNLKSSNVLLDENDVAMVCDHGLTSFISASLAERRIVAYKSPEYVHRRCKISRKADVWSYGCLLLELITGRPSAYSAPRGFEGVELYSWVQRAVREEWTCEVFDSEISVQRGAVKGMFELLKVALRCCEISPEKRPEMGEIVKEVERIQSGDFGAEENYSSERSSVDESLSSN